MESDWESEGDYLRHELEYMVSRGFIPKEEQRRMLKAWGLVEEEEVKNMKVKEFEVNYLEKIPAGRFQSQAYGVAMRIQLESDNEQETAEELAHAFSKAKETVKSQINLAKNNGN